MLKRLPSLSATIGLTDAQRRKVDRYLDTTRASLLFARQVVLVEGIAEALLLRTLAEKIVYPASADSDTNAGRVNRRLREQFRAISVVPIGGVDFMPYLKLLFHDHIALADRVVVITDGDGGAGENRRHDLTEVFQRHVDSGHLSILVGGTTLEAELFALPDNEAVLRQASRLNIHARSKSGMCSCRRGRARSLSERPLSAGRSKRGASIWERETSVEPIAELIVAAPGNGQFQVPPYLEEAIRTAVIEPLLDTDPEVDGATG